MEAKEEDLYLMLGCKFVKGSKGEWKLFKFMEISNPILKLNIQIEFFKLKIEQTNKWVLYLIESEFLFEELLNFAQLGFGFFKLVIKLIEMTS